MVQHLVPGMTPVGHAGGDTVADGRGPVGLDLSAGLRPVPGGRIAALPERIEAPARARYRDAGGIRGLIHASQVIRLKMRLLSRCGVADSRCECSLTSRVNSASRAHRALHQAQNPRF